MCFSLLQMIGYFDMYTFDSQPAPDEFVIKSLGFTTTNTLLSIVSSTSIVWSQPVCMQFSLISLDLRHVMSGTMTKQFLIFKQQK